MTETKLIRKWSKAEEKNLLESVAGGKSYDDISKELGRTAGACAIRVKKLCLEMYEKHNEDMAELCNKYHLTPQDFVDQKEITERQAKKRTGGAIATPPATTKDQIRSLLQAAIELL